MLQMEKVADLLGFVVIGGYAIYVVLLIGFYTID
jgi:hypothetical protein